MKLNLKQLATTLDKVIKTNDAQQEKGFVPVTIEVKAGAGIGKTSAIRQLAKRLDKNFVFLSAASFNEVSDLLGFPYVEHECCIDGGECVWVAQRLIEEYSKNGYHFTGNTRTSYAPPAWITGLDLSKGIILLLDDWTRANTDIHQAIMEFMITQEYLSWSLPKGSTIVLTANPEQDEESGETYNVKSTDFAQRTRKLSLEVIFDVKVWAEWATFVGLNEHVINFAVFQPELVRKMTARLYSLFGQMITNINEKDFILAMCSATEYEQLYPAFATFLNERLHESFTAEEFYALPQKDAITKLKKFIEPTKGNRDAAREYIMLLRIANYICLHPEVDANRFSSLYGDAFFDADKLIVLVQSLPDEIKLNPSFQSQYTMLVTNQRK